MKICKVSDGLYVRTGEHREPRVGEYLEGLDGFIHQMGSDTHFTQRFIVQPIESVMTTGATSAEWPKYDT